MLMIYSLYTGNWWWRFKGTIPPKYKWVSQRVYCACGSMDEEGLQEHGLWVLRRVWGAQKHLHHNKIPSYGRWCLPRNCTGRSTLRWHYEFTIHSGYNLIFPKITCSSTVVEGRNYVKLLWGSFDNTPTLESINSFVARIHCICLFYWLQNQCFIFSMMPLEKSLYALRNICTRTVAYRILGKM